MSTKERTLNSCSILRDSPLKLVSSSKQSVPKSCNSSNARKETATYQLSSYGYIPSLTGHTSSKKPDNPFVTTPEPSKRKGTMVTTSSTRRSSFIYGSTEAPLPSLAESWDPTCANNPDFALEPTNDPAYLSMDSRTCYNSNVWNVVRSLKGSKIAPQNKKCVNLYKLQAERRFNSPKVIRAVPLEPFIKELKRNHCHRMEKEQGIRKRKVSPLNDDSKEDISRIYKPEVFKKKVGLNLFLDNLALNSTKDRKIPDASNGDKMFANENPRFDPTIHGKSKLKGCFLYGIKQTIGAPTRNLLCRLEAKLKERVRGAGPTFGKPVPDVCKVCLK